RLDGATGFRRSIPCREHGWTDPLGSAHTRVFLRERTPGGIELRVTHAQAAITRNIVQTNATAGVASTLPTWPTAVAAADARDAGAIAPRPPRCAGSRRHRRTRARGDRSGSPPRDTSRA